MTNKEKLQELSSKIKELNSQFFKLEELITFDGFGDMNELQAYQEMPAKINQALINYHAFVVKIVHDKLELEEQYIA